MEHLNKNYKYQELFCNSLNFLINFSILQLGPSLQEEEDAQTEYPVFSMDNSQKDFCDMKTIRMEILD
ncbi:hypothetical protein PVNG_03842 [Plasmodium vivax North Korean]|uniref:Uncharacterized protein n=1 Tax=Plasmodium vivax North Korean TaxID=1035514 RepID=A0A0J9WDC8_PLAVI|nr:hypothetical protein PVNG_03842 [Plasmodium vivax North Korean]